MTALLRTLRELRTLRMSGRPARFRRVLVGWSTPRAEGGRIPPRREENDDSVPVMLSPGAVAVSRAFYEAIGPDFLRRLDGPGPDTEITIVEPDGTLTEG